MPSSLEAVFNTYCQLHDLPMPLPQYKFHPTRRWRFDFAWPEYRLAVEIDGGTWSGGRHVRGEGYAKDCEKLNAAVLCGWRVLRFVGKQVKTGKAINAVCEALGYPDHRTEPAGTHGG